MHTFAIDQRRLQDIVAERSPKLASCIFRSANNCHPKAAIEWIPTGGKRKIRLNKTAKYIQRRSKRHGCELGRKGSRVGSGAVEITCCPIFQ